MSASLVGSEMCIRDSLSTTPTTARTHTHTPTPTPNHTDNANTNTHAPVSYARLTLPTICSV
eukprot:1845997-Alexandrium_andersonii.AAC.1